MRSDRNRTPPRSLPDREAAEKARADHELVVQHYPSAHAVQQGLTFVYIRTASKPNKGGHDLLGSGKNDRDAWADAADRVRSDLAEQAEETAESEPPGLPFRP